MINQNYNLLKESYLFTDMARKAKAFKQANPAVEVISLGIGDVSRPLAPSIVEAMQNAVLEMGKKETFRGYGPEQGYDFLKEAIKNDYASRGISLLPNEIFVSDGAKSDIGNILNIFDKGLTVAVQNPSYPVYVDSNIMSGNRIVFMEGNASNGFLPLPDDLKQHADLIYLCSPNNPTGAVYNRRQLTEWVDYANKNKSIILFDSAYEKFIVEDLPRSIFEIDGAKDCAIEINSFSKSAGFTGVRCGYTVIPVTLVKENLSLNKMWLRRQTTLFNGVGYIVQRGAEASLTKIGQAQCKESIQVYQNNAKTIMSALDSIGIKYFGGINAPYIWLNCKIDSWQFFDKLLSIGVIGTPGVGFGTQGEGYFRLTSFNSEENTKKAIEKIINSNLFK